MKILIGIFLIFSLSCTKEYIEDLKVGDCIIWDYRYKDQDSLEEWEAPETSWFQVTKIGIKNYQLLSYWNRVDSASHYMTMPKEWNYTPIECPANAEKIK